MTTVTDAQTDAQTDAELVARFLREHGATKCPPACAAATSATISPEAAQAHQARGLDPVGDAWRKKAKGGLAAYWKKRKGQQA